MDAKPWTDRDDILFHIKYAISKSIWVVKKARNMDVNEKLAEEILAKVESGGYKVVRTKPKGEFPG